MHLQDQPRLEAVQRVVDPDHRDLDDVGRAALDRAVHRETLAHLAHHVVRRGDLADAALSAHHRADEALLLAVSDLFVHEVLDRLVLFEIVLYIVFGFLPRHVDLGAEAECAHAVDDAEVDRLRAAPLLRRDLVLRDAEHPRGRRLVDVLAVVERIDQSRVLAHVSQHAKLDLRVVGARQNAALLRDEGASQSAAELLADRDVLKVRVGARDPSRRRHRLVEVSVYLAVARDKREQTVDICSAQLGKHPVFEDHRHYRMIVFYLFKRLRVRGVAALRFLSCLESELFEEDRSELLRRFDVELLACKLVDAAGQLVNSSADVRPCFFEFGAVDAESFEFHRRHYFDQRKLDVIEHSREFFFFKPCLLQQRHLRRKSAPLQSVLGELIAAVFFLVRKPKRHLYLSASFIKILFRSDALPEVLFTENVHLIVAAARIENVLSNRSIESGHDAAKAVPLEHIVIPLQVVAHDRRLLLVEYGAESFEDSGVFRIYIEVLFVDQQADSRNVRHGGMAVIAEHLHHDEATLLHSPVDKRKVSPRAHDDSVDIQLFIFVFGFRLRRSVHVLEEAVELEPEIDLDELFSVRFLDDGLLDIETELILERHVRYDRREPLALRRELSVLVDRFPDSSFQFVRVLQQSFDASVLLDQFGSRLFADSRKTRDIVRLVSHKPFIVNELRRCEAVLRDERFLVVSFELRYALPRDDDGRPVRRELQFVLVSCYDQRLHAFFFGRLRNRSDDVVSLVSFDL